ILHGIRSCMRYFHDELQAEIAPVHVLTPAQLGLSLELNGPWIEQYRPAAQNALKEFIGQMHFDFEMDPAVLVESSGSSVRSAEALAEYGRQVGADVILAGSHGRSGIRRLFLGSFAETLVTHSKVPVMVVGPHSRPQA